MNAEKLKALLIAAGIAEDRAEKIAAQVEEAGAEDTPESEAEALPEAETGVEAEAETVAEAVEEAAEEAAAPEMEAEAETAVPQEAAETEAPAEDGRLSTLIDRLMAAEIRCCALECGVDPKRMGVLVRLADTSTVDPAAENLHEQVMAAVKAALKEVPELSRSAVSGGLGAHARMNTGNDDVAAKFRSGF